MDDEKYYEEWGYMVKILLRRECRTAEELYARFMDDKCIKVRYLPIRKAIYKQIAEEKGFDTKLYQ